MVSNSHAIVVAEGQSPEIVPVTAGGLGAGEVLVRTHYSGISSGTDRWVMRGRFLPGGLRYPLVVGYQRVGVVEAIGKDVTTVEVGQTVATTRSVDFAEFPSTWGAHASLGVSSEADVLSAEGVNPLAAALLVSSQVGVNAASRLTCAPGTVWVVGDGIIAAAGALALKARGYDPVVLGRKAARLGTLVELGIGVLNVKEDPELHSADDPIAVIDTIQNDGSFGSYVQRLPERVGQIVYSGHPVDGVTQWGNLARLQQRELSTHFISGWTTDRLVQTLDLMHTGVLPIERLVGTVAAGRNDITGLVSSVARGEMASIGAVIDWQRLS